MNRFDTGIFITSRSFLYHEFAHLSSRSIIVSHLIINFLIHVLKNVFNDFDKITS